jgi:L-rhamnose mutarotase
MLWTRILEKLDLLPSNSEKLLLTRCWTLCWFLSCIRLVLFLRIRLSQWIKLKQSNYPYYDSSAWTKELPHTLSLWTTVWLWIRANVNKVKVKLSKLKREKSPTRKRSAWQYQSLEVVKLENLHSYTNFLNVPRNKGFKSRIAKEKKCKKWWKNSSKITKGFKRTWRSSHVNWVEEINQDQIRFIARAANQIKKKLKVQKAR